jgi:hypothetical protein
VSNAAIARASNFGIFALEGGDYESRAAARTCFDSVFGNRTFEAAKTKESGAFLEYDGVYPGAIPVFFTPKADPLTGREKVADELSPGFKLKPTDKARAH